MRISTDLLYRLVRSAPAGDPEGAEQSLIIFPGLAPIIEVPFPLDPAAIVAATVQRQSFRLTQFDGRVASSAAVDLALATLGKGLWDAEFTAGVAGSFTQVFDGTIQPALKIVLREPGGADSSIVSLITVANVPSVVSGRVRFLLEADSWVLRLQMIATGVGQTLAAHSTWSFNKLV